MTDEKYLFLRDAAEKKNVARSSFNTGKRGRGAVKFPSDYMTKKERDALNGEMSTYNLRKPMKWKEFMSMPEDLQKQYIQWLDQAFNVGDRFLAEMFGVSQKTINLRREALCVQCHGRKGKRPNDTILRWETFLNGDKPQEKPHETKQPLEEQRPGPVEQVEEAKPTEGKPFGVAAGSFDAFASPAELAQMLSMIAGTERRQYSVKFR